MHDSRLPPVRIDTRHTWPCFGARRLVPWTQPGAWGDCGLSWSVPVPAGSAVNGLAFVSVQLPAATIQAWAADGGATNYGLLLR